MGRLIGLGGDDKLTVSVSSFDPQVRCEGLVGGPGIVNSCYNLLDAMPASSVLLYFGVEGSSPTLDYALPYSLKSGNFLFSLSQLN